jgi:hypothetical protein
MSLPDAPANHELEFEMLAQPDDTTCGPTCLHAIYRYHGREVPLRQLIDEVPKLETGGTLGVLLALDALNRGYQATIYSYNLQIFDPTWFKLPADALIAKLEAQEKVRRSIKRKLAIRAYIEFLRLGGRVQFEPLSGALIRRYLIRGFPIIAGLSSTYLYEAMREFGPNDDDDDLRGGPAGHFVVMYGYDRRTRGVSIADPLLANPHSSTRHYPIGVDRVLSSVLLGVLTYDANLIIIQPPHDKPTAK